MGELSGIYEFSDFNAWQDLTAQDTAAAAAEGTTSEAGPVAQLKGRGSPHTPPSFIIGPGSWILVAGSRHAYNAYN